MGNQILFHMSGYLTDPIHASTFYDTPIKFHSVSRVIFLCHQPVYVVLWFW